MEIPRETRSQHRTSWCYLFTALLIGERSVLSVYLYGTSPVLQVPVYNARYSDVLIKLCSTSSAVDCAQSKHSLSLAGCSLCFGQMLAAELMLLVVVAVIEGQYILAYLKS